MSLFFHRFHDPFCFRSIGHGQTRREAGEGKGRNSGEAKERKEAAAGGVGHAQEAFVLLPAIHDGAKAVEAESGRQGQ